MRSPLAPTVYRRSRQQRGVVPPVFYISKSRGDYFDPKKYFHVSFYPSFCFWFLVDLVTMLRKYYAFFVYFLQVKMGKTEKNQKENHATKMTKIPKTKRRKHGMKEKQKEKF